MEVVAVDLEETAGSDFNPYFLSLFSFFLSVCLSVRLFCSWTGSRLFGSDYLARTRLGVAESGVFLSMDRTQQRTEERRKKKKRREKR